jgi:DNA-binding MurR/RpiR family transcriptional regulator
VQDTDMRHGSLPVKYAQLAIADCVYSAVAQLTFDESTEGLARTSRALVSHRVAHKPRGAATSETTQELT